MFPFGVTFYPDQWPKDTWDESFRQIRSVGFNCVRFNEMAWDLIEPQPGKFNFKDLDLAMDLCKKHGLKVLLGIPTSQVPPWFHKKFKNSRPVAQDGTLYPEYGPRPNICKDNPIYRKLAARLAQKLVARYKNHPALMMWQLDNEPVYPPLDHTTSNDYCHCEHSRQAFIAWARKKYGTIKKLNEVWGTKFWTNSFFSFDEIQTPKAGIWEAVSPHIFLDWYRFKTDSIKNWIEHLATTVRKIDKEHKVGTNGFVGICTRTPEHNLIPEKLDWYGLDIYPMGNRLDHDGLAFILDLWRSFTRNSKAEFHITELQGGQNVRWGYPGYVKGPEITDWVNNSLEHGAQAILFHAWRPPIFGAETGGFGILKTDGSPTKRLEVIKNVAAKFTLPTLKGNVAAKLASPTIRGRASSAATKNNTAIAYLHSSEVQSYQEQGPARGISGQWEAVRSDIGIMHGIFSIQGAYKAAAKGKPIDFIFEQDLDKGDLPYKTILMPNPYLLSMKQYNNIKKWVKDGGTLITEARFGLKDENGHLYLKPLMEDLLGIVYDHTEVTKDGFLDAVKNVAASFSSPTYKGKASFATTKNTKKQIITKKLGRGKVIYANFSLFLEVKNGNSKQAKIVQQSTR